MEWIAGWEVKCRERGGGWVGCGVGCGVGGSEIPGAGWGWDGVRDRLAKG